MMKQTQVVGGVGEFTASGVGGLSLTFAEPLPYPATSLTLVSGAGALREVGVAERDLTSLTLVRGGRHGAYASFAANAGTAGKMAVLNPSFTSILAGCETHDGWWKGNLHTHTSASDGSATPSAVAAWYFGHGYDFVSLSDHDLVTTYPSLDLLVLPGIEVTAANSPALHVVVTNVDGAIAGGSGTHTEAIEAVLSAAPASALAHLAHPGWQGVLTPAEIAAVDGLGFIEVYNGVPSIGSAEAMWDAVLLARIAAGNFAPLYGLAVDDAHVFPGTSTDAAPGRGWIMVRASGLLTFESVISAIKSGDFYASSGATLETLTRTADRVALTVQPDGATYRIRVVVGRAGGVTTTEIDGPEAEYQLTTGDLYARLVAVAADGRMAWSQPVMAVQ